MSPLRERAFDELAMLPEEQLAFIITMFDGLKRLTQPHGTESEDPFYSSSNQQFIEEGIQALSAGQGMEHDLIEV